ncbi:MAG TPA: GAF domain-containing protein, partial [Gaiellaceae bacterium]|nr:GAF domain-containing protein [Gaiellaceae bacterium]
MSIETQAVLIDAVPLLVLAAVYLAATALLAPSLRRDRQVAQPLARPLVAVFPAVAVLALVLAGVVLDDRAPLGAGPWPAFAGTLVLLVPGAVVLARFAARARAGGARLVLEREERVSLRDRELGAVSAISSALAGTQGAIAIGRVVADEVGRLLGVEFAAVALVDEQTGTAEGLVARCDGEDLEWWAGQRIDLREEASGIASAVFEAAPVQVYDVAASSLVSRRLAELVGARSGAWVPMIAEERVIGVLVLATIGRYRSFSREELDALQAIASEAGLALDRSRSAIALADALERERLLAEISRKVRSEHDVDSLMRVAVEETGRALAASRCLLRLGEADAPVLAAEWHESGREPAQGVELLAVSNLAARERHTIAIEDAATAPELEDESLGGRETLLGLGSRAVLSVPIVFFERLIGVVAVHGAAPRRWTRAEIFLVESVARELGLALQNVRLLGENRRRLEQQTSLLHAAQVLTSEL